MTKLPTMLALLVYLSWSGDARADDWPKGFTCAFKTGTSANQVEGTFQQAPAAPLSFEVKAVDLEGQLAQMITKPGAAPAALRIVRALNANHFIEVLNEGFLSLTTVYDKVASTGEFPAVHSRHVGVLGQAVIAQYLGSCKSS